MDLITVQNKKAITEIRIFPDLLCGSRGSLSGPETPEIRFSGSKLQ